MQKPRSSEETSAPPGSWFMPRLAGWQGVLETVLEPAEEEEEEEAEEREVMLPLLPPLSPRDKEKG
ncbi:hypothetical protein JRQ81_018421 [Phrynocephalus forsythii]|uniref:Uncharacterized protein n=1 Tax=Phrynocephalus forsythii TaxID=171643 RepID=A0A9Q0XPI2_9SAUR|nr:hypothetical protein JRQ81_018421 [Phrynocephalus forsythii]